MKYRSFLFAAVLIVGSLLVSGCANHRTAWLLTDLCTETLCAAEQIDLTQLYQMRQAWLVQQRQEGMCMRPGWRPDAPSI